MAAVEQAMPEAEISPPSSLTPEVPKKTRSLRRTLSLGTSKAMRGVKAAVKIPAKKSLNFVKAMSNPSPTGTMKVKAVEGDEGADAVVTPPESSNGDSADESVVSKALSDFTNGIIGWASEAGLLPKAEPEPEAKVVEVSIVKHGVPWRGSYERKLVVDTEAAKVTTVDPESGKETNAWLSPRDVPKVITRAEDDSIELVVAPWPEAPGWLHQRLRFSFSTSSASAEEEQKKATLKALEKAGVAVEAC